MIPVWLYVLIFIELSYVCYFDIKYKKIKNNVVLFNIALYLILLMVEPNYFFFNLANFLYPLTFLFVGIILFALKVMGAGDVKFLFSFFLVVPLVMHDTVFLHLLITTICIGGFLLLTSLGKYSKEILFSMRSGQFHLLKNYFSSQFPYAPVIFISWCWLAVELYLSKKFV